MSYPSIINSVSAHILFKKIQITKTSLITCIRNRMLILQPVDQMRQANIGLCRTPEYNKRAHTHLLIVRLRLQHCLLLHTELAFGGCDAILIFGNALVHTTVGNRGRAQIECTVSANGESATGHQLFILGPIDLGPWRAKRGTMYCRRVALNHSRLLGWWILNFWRLV